MKDSGVEWIGDIPEHWDFRKVKDICTNHDGKRVPISSPDRIFGNYPYYGATGIVDYVDNYIFDGEYLLIGEDGAPFKDKTKNLSFIVKGRFWVNNHAHVLSVHGISTMFLSSFLNMKDYSDVIAGSTREKLNKADLQDIAVPYPPKEEQTLISISLEKFQKECFKLFSEIDHKITTLKEYRKTLINEFVTGKRRSLY
jgi:type I restriction enzyme S subunit